MIYLVNKNSHYFAIDRNVNLSEIEGSIVLESKLDMYNWVMDNNGLDWDEVEDTEIDITADGYISDFCGGLHKIKGNVEKYIQEYVI